MEPPNLSRRAASWVSRGLYLAVGAAVAWWLFADTVRKAWPHPAGDAAGGVLTLRFTHFGDFQDYELWRDVIADFERAYPGVRVRQEYAPGMYGHYNIRLRRQIMSETLPDVALIQLGPYVETAWAFADVTALVRSLAPRLEAGAVDAFRVSGRWRALPVSGGTLQVYINPDCFDRAGAVLQQDVPLPGRDWTIAEFHGLARRLTCDLDGDGRIDQFGFWHPRWVYFLPFIWSMGADVVDERTGRWALIGPRARAAMTLYHELLVEDHACPREDEVAQLFQDVGFLTGRVAMCVNGPWFQPFLARTRLADRYRVLPIPSGPGGRWTRVTWDGLAVAGTARGPRRDAAVAFVRFALSRPVQDRIARLGRALPARSASMPVFVRGGDAARRAAFVRALDHARTQPRLPGFARMDRAIQDHLRRFLSMPSSSSVDEMLAALASDPNVRAALGRAPTDAP